MKRTIPLILIATLTACASTPTTVPLATPYPATATESSAATPAPTTEIAPFYHVSDTLNTGDAYYSFGQKPGYALLLKTDYATATQTVFCEVPGCTHDTNACPAYFPGYYSDYIIAGGNPCYVCHISRDMGSMTWDEYYETNVKFWLEHPDGIVADFTPDEIEVFWRAAWEEANTPTSVYAVDPATGKTCTEVERVNDRYGFIYSDGTALYGQIDMGLQPDATAACRLDLTTAQAEEFTLLPSERIIDLYDGGIMTARYVADAPLPTDWEMFCAAIQAATVEFDCWDPRTNERTKLAERPYNGADVLTSGYAATDGSRLYFVEEKDLGEGAYERLGLTAIDPAVNTTETIWDTWPDERAGMSMPNIQPAHGDKSTQWLWLRYNNTAEQMPEYRALVNTKTWKISPLKQEVHNDERYISALAQTNDGRLLIWTQSNPGGYCNGMGLITPEELAAGSTDWQPVTMWQG